MVQPLLRIINHSILAQTQRWSQTTVEGTEEGDWFSRDWGAGSRQGRISVINLEETEVATPKHGGKTWAAFHTAGTAPSRLGCMTQCCVCRELEAGSAEDEVEKEM